MDEHERYGRWKKLFRGPKALALWGSLIVLVLAAAVFLTALAYSDNPAANPFLATSAMTAIGIVALLVLVFAAWPMVRWLFWKHWRPTLLVIGCAVGLTALFYGEQDWAGKRAWMHYKRAEEAKGESLELAGFIPPPVPDGQNFVMTPIVASCYAAMLDKNGHELNPRNTSVVDQLAMRIERTDNWNTPTNGDWTKGTVTDLRAWQAYYRAPLETNKASARTNEFPVSPQPQSPAEDVLLALSRYDSAIEELRRAGELPYSRFPLEYDKDVPWAILLPHLGALKRCCVVLELRAIAELQAHQIDRAAADVKLMLRLADALRDEPFPISHLVRISILNITLQPIYEGLAAHQWTDAQLGMFDSELAKLDFLADYERSMRSQAAFTVKMIEHLRKTRKISDYFAIFDQNGNQNGNRGWDYVCAASPGGWFYQNEVRFSEFYLQESVPLADVAHKRVSPA